jgi:hypothetical protein
MCQQGDHFTELNSPLCDEPLLKVQAQICTLSNTVPQGIHQLLHTLAVSTYNYGKCTKAQVCFGLLGPFEYTHD